MEKVVALTKRRGFIYPSSEIYGGLSGFYDYGPYGVALKRAIRDLWWRHVVDLRDDVVVRPLDPAPPSRPICAAVPADYCAPAATAMLEVLRELSESWVAERSALTPA